MSEIDEQALVRKAAKGDADAFEQLLLKYQTPVYHLAMRMTGNPDDAADMTQEAFLKAWRSLDSFQFNSSFSSWLFRLASNTCLDFLRSAKRRQTVDITLVDDEGEEQTMEFVDTAPTPEEAVLANEDRESLRQALSLLEPEQRQLLALRVVSNMSYGDIAKALGIKEGTVKSRLARARENLQKKLLQIGNKSVSQTSKLVKGGYGNEL